MISLGPVSELNNATLDPDRYAYDISYIVHKTFQAAEKSEFRGSE